MAILSTFFVKVALIGNYIVEVSFLAAFKRLDSSKSINKCLQSPIPNIIDDFKIHKTFQKSIINSQSLAEKNQIFPMLLNNTQSHLIA